MTLTPLLSLDKVVGTEIARDYLKTRLAATLDILDQAVTLTGTQALTNKTLTAPTVSGTLAMSTAASRIKPGGTSFAIRNNADSADNVLVSDAGAVTVRSSLTVTGNLILNGATLTWNYVTPAWEIGSTSTGNTPVLDFHSSGNNIDYDTRFLFNGGNGTSGNGTMTLYGQLQVQGQATPGNPSLVISAGGLQVTAGGLLVTAGDVTLAGAALATNATSGFLNIPTCAGTPTGAYTPPTGTVALVFDTTGKFLWVRSGGAWLKSTVYA